MTIKEYKRQILFFTGGDIEKIKMSMKNANEKCLFLQNIYSERRYDFSSQFTDAAVIERQDFCNISNACYLLLEEIKKGE